MTFTTEEILTSPNGFGLATASDLQRAVCRIVDGRPLGRLADVPEVRAAIGCDPAELPDCAPAEVLLLAAIRTAKSLLAAALAVRATQVCDVSRLGHGETPRVSVVSLTTDLASAVFQHIAGNVQASPVLRKLLVEPPTSDTVTLRHPTGRPVEIRVVAGSRAGASLVARWSAGAIFDEAPRMVGAEDGVVNLDHADAAVDGRLLPGAQKIKIGSPWAPFGPVYDTVQAHWGHPTRDRVVIRGTGPAMNPVWWTPERVTDLERRNPIAFRTDVLGEFADPESGLFAPDAIDACRRKLEGDIPWRAELRGRYSAAMDPSSGSASGNAWTLAIAHGEQDASGSRVVIDAVREWRGLTPGCVLAEVADICDRYGVRVVATDQYAGSALADLARPHGLVLDVVNVTAPMRLDLYTSLATAVAEHRVELPSDPSVRSDLLSVRKRVTPTGYSIVLPVSADGRHADFAPSIALVNARAAEGTHVPMSEIETAPADTRFGDDGDRWAGMSARGY